MPAPGAGLILALSRAHHGAQNVVVHELDDGTTLVWELLDAEPDDALLAAPVTVEPGWLMRHDRIDFPPGGIAYRHTHPGPGIRYLLHGSIRIESRWGLFASSVTTTFLVSGVTRSMPT